MAVEIVGSGDVVTVQSTSATVNACSPSWSVGVSSAVVAGGIPYTGSYEITPCAEEQTIGTAARVFDRDITIKPIPSNYGLVTWDGSTITVS